MQAPATLNPGFMVIHGNRLEDLRELAVQWMRQHPLDPLENEVVLVQSNGIAQWLKLALAANDSCGVAAAVQVELPARFLWQSYRGVLGSDSIPLQSPLDKQPLTWRLMRLLPGLLQDPLFAPLARFLAGDDDLRKRYQLAERLADLLDQYQVYRADWLADWAAGRDQLHCLRRGPQPLDAAQLWQPALWRALLEDVGREQLADSRAGVHPRFVQALSEAGERPVSLPRRVVVFGISSLPAQALEALAAMARFSQVLLCVHNPCQHHWGDIVADQDLLRHQFRRHQRRPGLPAALQDDELHQHAHPLLAAWGKQGRDYINLLDQHDDPEHYRQRFDAMQMRIDLFESADTGHLLGQLQDDILHLRTPQETRAQWPALEPACDQSLRFHIAHSAQREVEILRDQLLAAFDADASLKPRDVLVMLPDVNSYAPYIQAVFGQYGRDDPRWIPFTLADQGQRGQDPLLIAIEQLLQLPQARLGVSEVLDLLDVPALRARFAIDEASLPTLRRWIEGAGIRWGLDARRRAALGLPEGLEQNSWRFGLRRMLLGYAVGRGRAWGEIEPFDEIGGLDAALIGPLVQLLDALDLFQQRLGRDCTPAGWGEAFRDLLLAFFRPEDSHDEDLLARLLDGLDQWLALCDAVALDDSLPLTVAREAWLGQVDQGRLSQRFLAGSVNFCTLMPMRAIPFRHVCLLGMQDGNYPRSHVPLDFDLMAGDYRPGDRSRREDDRYLLLEALLSARDQLYVSWVGRSIRDNSERPPSVLIGQLRDHVASCWRLAGHEADEGALLQALTTEHPLQPFSRDYFFPQPREHGAPLFSYAREWAGLHQPVTEQEAVLQPLPPFVLEGALTLESLQSFLRNPVHWFFSQRLKVQLEHEEQPELDEEPFAPDALQLWQFKSQLLQQARQGLEQGQDAGQLDALLQAAADSLQRSGQWPLAGFGQLLRDQLLPPLAGQLQRWCTQVAGLPPPQEEPQLLAHAGVEGWLTGLRHVPGPAGGPLLVLLQVGKLYDDKGKELRRDKLLTQHVLQVLACASALPLSLLLVAEDVTLRLPAIEAERAQRQLQGWVAIWREGCDRPLPVALRSALAWLGAGGSEEAGDKARKKAQDAYEDGFNTTGEVSRSASLARQYPDFASLTADEDFWALACELYAGLASLVVEDVNEVPA